MANSPRLPRKFGTQKNQNRVLLKELVAQAHSHSDESDDFWDEYDSGVQPFEVRYQLGD